MIILHVMQYNMHEGGEKSYTKEYSSQKVLSINYKLVQQSVEKQEKLGALWQVVMREKGLLPSPGKLTKTVEQ